jgi:hypothetical protein
VPVFIIPSFTAEFRHWHQGRFMILRQDVLRLIFLIEKLHIASLEGTLSTDEAIVIRRCASELLKTILLEPAPAASLNGKDLQEIRS